MNPLFSASLPERLKKALTKMNYETPTPIQEAAIPVALEGSDIVGLAQTGTGKTAAFAIPLVTQCILDPNKQMLVLAPTRELAAQIREVIVELSSFSNDVRSVLIVGGAMMRRQLQALERRPNIIVATPGRLMDHIQRGTVRLSNTSIVVLDEADRMLDMGFGPQIEEILEFLPKVRQTLLFSATLPPKIKKLSERYLNSPKFISVGTVDQANSKVEQTHIELPGGEKSLRLMEEIKTRKVKTLVFTRTKRGADKLKKILERNGFDTACIHGDRSQPQRDKAIKNFKSGVCNIMVATDVASRGLDVDQIKLVVNYDLPETAEDYIHRIGRTGRAGETGLAISFVTKEEFSHWRYLQNPKGNKSPGPSQRRGRRQQRPQQGRSAADRKRRSGFGGWKTYENTNTNFRKKSA